MLDSLLFRLKIFSQRISEKVLLETAFRLPKRIVYFCAIRVWSYATSADGYEKTIIPEITMAECLKRFEKGMYK